MRVRLTADDLIQIASAVSKIEQLKVHISQFESNQHVVDLEWTNDQRDGTSVSVVGITAKRDYHKQAMRGEPVPGR